MIIYNQISFSFILRYRTQNKKIRKFKVVAKTQSFPEFTHSAICPFQKLTCRIYLSPWAWNLQWMFKIKCLRDPYHVLKFFRLIEPRFPKSIYNKIAVYTNSSIPSAAYFQFQFQNDPRNFFLQVWTIKPAFKSSLVYIVS